MTLTGAQLAPWLVYSNSKYSYVQGNYYYTGTFGDSTFAFPISLHRILNITVKTYSSNSSNIQQYSLKSLVSNTNPPEVSIWTKYSISGGNLYLMHYDNGTTNGGYTSYTNNFTGYYDDNISGYNLFEKLPTPTKGDRNKIALRVNATSGSSITITELTIVYV